MTHNIVVYDENHPASFYTVINKANGTYLDGSFNQRHIAQKAKEHLSNDDNDLYIIEIHSPIECKYADWLARCENDKHWSESLAKQESKNKITVNWRQARQARVYTLKEIEEGALDG